MKITRRGFSLLEVLVSMALIATALLAVLRLQARNLDLQSEARFLTIAKLLAQERLALIDAGPAFTEGNASGEFGGKFDSFEYLQEIERVSSGRGLYRVRVTVSLREKEAPQNFSMESYLYRSDG